MLYSMSRDAKDLLIVRAEGFAIHVEQEAPRCVGASGDHYILSRGRVRGSREWEIGDGFAEVIL